MLPKITALRDALHCMDNVSETFENYLEIERNPQWDERSSNALALCAVLKECLSGELGKEEERKKAADAEGFKEILENFEARSLLLKKIKLQKIQEILNEGEN